LSFASMSDIAFLLIIFFMVAGKFTQPTEKDVPLPSVDLGEKTQPREIRIVVTKQGQYYLNGTLVTHPEDLPQEVALYITEDSTAEERTVSIYADRDAEYGAVATAIEAVNQADAYLELAVRFTR